MMTFIEARTVIRQTLCLYIMLGSKVRGQLIIVNILQRTHYLLPPGSESIETFYHWVSRASSIISLTFIDVITLMSVPRVS